MGMGRRQRGNGRGAVLPRGTSVTRDSLRVSLCQRCLLQVKAPLSALAGRQQLHSSTNPPLGTAGADGKISWLPWKSLSRLWGFCSFLYFKPQFRSPVLSCAAGNPPEAALSRSAPALAQGRGSKCSCGAGEGVGSCFASSSPPEPFCDPAALCSLLSTPHRGLCLPCLPPRGFLWAQHPCPLSRCSMWIFPPSSNAR